MSGLETGQLLLNQRYICHDTVFSGVAHYCDISMHSQIDTLGFDIFAHIISHLHVSDVGALRLSCHAVDNVLTQTSYVQHFRSKTITLSQTNLQKLVHLTSSPGLGCLLEDCTIAELSTAPAQETAQALELLAAAFGNLKRHMQDKPLRSLTLQIQAVDRDGIGDCRPSESFGSSRAIWVSARSTFATVMGGSVLRATCRVAPTQPLPQPKGLQSRL